MNQQYVYLINKTTPVNSLFMNIQSSGSRLRAALHTLGRTPKAFTADFGISPQTLNNWFGRGVPGKHILRVAKHLGLEAEWLESGTGEPFASGTLRVGAATRLPYLADEFIASSMTDPHSPAAMENVEPALQPTRAFEYPEVSWVQAGSASEAMELANLAACPKHTSDVWAEGAFWLRVTGSSMTSASEASFPEGHLILVAPDIEPRSGQYVVARMINTNEATFKQLVRDAGDFYLKPINPAFPVKKMDKEWEIVGTVVDGKMPKSIFL